MSDDQFWVNPDGLANSADGFHEKAVTVRQILVQIADLSAADQSAVVGGDDQGQALWRQLQSCSSQMQDGLGKWSDGIHGTGDALVKSARVFGATEENNTKLAGRISHAIADSDATAPRQYLADESEQQPLVQGTTERRKMVTIAGGGPDDAVPREYHELAQGQTNRKLATIAGGGPDDAVPREYHELAQGQTNRKLATIAGGGPDDVVPREYHELAQGQTNRKLATIAGGGPDDAVPREYHELAQGQLIEGARLGPRMAQGRVIADTVLDEDGNPVPMQARVTDKGADLGARLISREPVQERLLRTEAEQPALRTEAEQPALRTEAEQPALRTEAQQPALRTEAQQPLLRTEAQQPLLRTEAVAQEPLLRTELMSDAFEAAPAAQFSAIQPAVPGIPATADPRSVDWVQPQPTTVQPALTTQPVLPVPPEPIVSKEERNLEQF